MKAHILIVEDEAILYERLRFKLSKANYSIADYAPSVSEAIGLINRKRPDLVLLDIDLQGEHNGIYLGRLLKEEYNIPFIYVTDFDDDQSFYEGLQTKHADFISKKEIQLQEAEVIQTKPHLDEKRLLRSIQTTLSKQAEAQPLLRESVMGLVGYLDEIKELDKNRITRVPVMYDDILYFTIKPYLNDDDEETALRANYLWFLTKKKEYFFLKSSLRDLQKSLPFNFVRINESYIVNINPDVLDGRINGSKLSINNQEFIIKSTYKSEVQKRLEHFYGG